MNTNKNLQHFISHHKILSKELTPLKLDSRDTHFQNYNKEKKLTISYRSKPLGLRNRVVDLLDKRQKTL